MLLVFKVPRPTQNASSRDGVWGINVLEIGRSCERLSDCGNSFVSNERPCVPRSSFAENATCGNRWVFTPDHGSVLVIARQTFVKMGPSVIPIRQDGQHGPGPGLARCARVRKVSYELVADRRSGKSSTDNLRGCSSVSGRLCHRPVPWWPAPAVLGSRHGKPRLRWSKAQAGSGHHRSTARGREDHSN
jgi:hypothetical protein